MAKVPIDTKQPTGTQEEWDLRRLPPEGHDDVAMFAYKLFETSLGEKLKLQLADRFLENYRLYRGDHWRKNRTLSKDDKHKVTVNLVFANIMRTVANLTSRNPIAEVKSTDGDDQIDIVVTQKIKNWWSDTEQISVLERSALNMEIYGITIEKSVPNIDKNKPDVVVVDPFSWFPAPGNFNDINDMPYMAVIDAMPIEDVESIWNVTGVKASDVYSIMGEDREEYKPMPSGISAGGSYYTSEYSNVIETAQPADYKHKRAMVIELWIKDYSKEVIETQDGVEVERNKYPGGIRVITITDGEDGYMVLSDKANPNINPELDRSLTKNSYLYDHFPFTKACSYEDTASIWGFANAEQTGDLNLKIDEIITRIAHYINLVCMPPLILPKDCGVPKQAVSNRAGLILQPDNQFVAQGIRFLQVPNLPSNFFDILNYYIQFFDRVYAMQDVDRGETPKNIQAASAIMALQERNAVLMRSKIRAMDFLVRQRGRMALSFYQNFGWMTEPLKVQDTMVEFRGTDQATRRFNYVVESGSTVAKTELQTLADAKELYQLGAIDRRALLETMNFPNWREVIERSGEGQLQQAGQIFIDAGLPPDVVQQMIQFAMEFQGQPGDVGGKSDGSGQPGANPTPKAYQGTVPPGVA